MKCKKDVQRPSVFKHFIFNANNLTYLLTFNVTKMFDVEGREDSNSIIIDFIKATSGAVIDNPGILIFIPSPCPELCWARRGK